MKFIEEIVVDVFLLMFCVFFVEDFCDCGFIQLEVVEVFGISQSVVLKYVYGEVVMNEWVVIDFCVVDFVFCVGDGFVIGDMMFVQVFVEVEVFIC